MKQIYSGKANKMYGMTTESQHICSIPKIILLIFIFTVISLPLISAIEFSLDSPNEVFSDEEFLVTISVVEDIQELYDVKIFSEDPDSSPKTISEIYNIKEEKWQNSYYYLGEIFPEQTEFKLKIKKQGEWQVCARLRKVSPSPPVCNPIKVFPSESQESNDENAQQNQESQQTQQEEQETNEKSNQKESKNNKTSNQRLSAPNKNEKIILNPPQNQEPSEAITTKEGNKRQIIIYSFIAFLVIIIILFALKRL